MSTTAVPNPVSSSSRKMSPAGGFSAWVQISQFQTLMESSGDLSHTLVELISRLMEAQETDIGLMEYFLMPDVDSGLAIHGNGGPEGQEAVRNLLSKYISAHGIPRLVEELRRILGQDFDEQLSTAYRNYRRYDDYQDEEML